jgi:hypothetical protein
MLGCGLPSGVDGTGVRRNSHTTSFDSALPRGAGMRTPPAAGRSQCQGEGERVCITCLQCRCLLSVPDDGVHSGFLIAYKIRKSITVALS